MAKHRKTSGKRKTTRRRRVGGMGGKLANRSISLQLYDLLYLAGGAVLNYAVVNPLINKITEKMTKGDGTPMLGEHQGKILTALKGGGAAWLAYSAKLPKEVKLALLGITGASGVEIAGQVMPDKMVALNGTGDLYLSGVGNTQMLEIPMRRKGVNGAGVDELNTFDVPTFGTGDLYTSDMVTM